MPMCLLVPLTRETIVGSSFWNLPEREYFQVCVHTHTHTMYTQTHINTHMQTQCIYTHINIHTYTQYTHIQTHFWHTSYTIHTALETCFPFNSISGKLLHLSPYRCPAFIFIYLILKR